MEGFVPFPFKIYETSSATHFLYIKQHQVREKHHRKPQDRTLFVINVPPYCDEECLKLLFGKFGAVQDVFFHQKPTASVPETNSKCSKYFQPDYSIKGFKVAYIVFTKVSSFKKALNVENEQTPVLCARKSDVEVGIKKWCQDYSRSLPDVGELKQEVEKYMEGYDKKVEEEKEEAKKMDGMPDEEGWITVTKHSKRSVIPRTEAVELKVTAKEGKKRSKKSLLNFYTFQIRESKMEHIAQLRRKFEEDKQRIAIMKANRKFKPY